MCVHVYSSAATVRKPLKCNILTADVLSDIVWCVLEEKVYTTFCGSLPAVETSMQWLTYRKSQQAQGHGQRSGATEGRKDDVSEVHEEGHGVAQDGQHRERLRSDAEVWK